jgi:hypothetical protein
MIINEDYCVRIKYPKEIKNPITVRRIRNRIIKELCKGKILESPSNLVESNSFSRNPICQYIFELFVTKEGLMVIEISYDAPKNSVDPVKDMTVCHSVEFIIFPKKTGVERKIIAILQEEIKEERF